MIAGISAQPDKPRPVNLLIVAGEPSIRRVLRTALRGYYSVTQAESGAAALRQFEAGAPDLLLLDLNLPDIEGTLVIQRLREKNAVPILALVACHDSVAARRALESGADDIVAKPFTMGVLLDRLATMLDARARADGALQFADFAIDLAKLTLTRDGIALPIAAMDLALLAALAARHGVVMTDEQLLRAAGGSGSRLDLRIAVHRIRALIEPDPLRPRHLWTEAGIGYRLIG
jgi:two-component system KDP operon response regulator KdpE